MVRFEYQSRRSAQVGYAPVIGFTASAGQSVEFRTTYDYDTTVGARLPVAYDPQQPEQARLAMADVLWGGPLLVLISGAGISVVTLGQMLRFIRQHRRNRA